jgi:hypothetical protein
MQSKVSTKCQLGMLIANWAQDRRSSQCTKMLIALRGSRGCALKANRSLSDLIIELKAD